MFIKNLIPLLFALVLYGCTPGMEVWIFNNTSGIIRLISGCGSIEIKKHKKGKFEHFCAIRGNFEVIYENNHWVYDREELTTKSYYSHARNKEDYIRLKRFSLTPKYYVRLQLENDGKLYSIPLKKDPPIGVETPQLDGFPLYPIKKLTSGSTRRE